VPEIHVEHLAKRYGPLQAVDDLSFTVKAGTVTGFLGPNGAGKTTTLRLSTALVRPDAGRTTFDGRLYAELARPLREVGVALEPTVFHPGRTALDHLLMLAPYAGVGRRRCDQVLKLVGLKDAATKRVGQFSLGMRGRLNLAYALLGDPGILLLDEPANGLDPEGIRWLRELLRALADQGRAILISSHLLSEVEQTVDEVVIIAHGRLVFQGALADLETPTTGVAVETPDPAGVRTLAAARGWTVAPGPAHSGTVVIRGAAATEVAREVVLAGIPLEGLHQQTTDLESVFLGLTEGEAGMR